MRDRVRLLRSVLSGGTAAAANLHAYLEGVVKGENLINPMNRVIKSSQTMVRCHKKLGFVKKLQTEIRLVISSQQRPKLPSVVIKTDAGLIPVMHHRAGNYLFPLVFKSLTPLLNDPNYIGLILFL